MITQYFIFGKDDSSILFQVTGAEELVTEWARKNEVVPLTEEEYDLEISNAQT
jgi:hypothetical protein